MYSKITNPETGRKVNLFGKIGQQVLKNYINVMNGGACKDENEECTSQPPGLSECCKGLKCQEPETVNYGNYRGNQRIHKPITIPGFKGECVDPKETAEHRKFAKSCPRGSRCY